MIVAEWSVIQVGLRIFGWKKSEPNVFIKLSVSEWVWKFRKLMLKSPINTCFDVLIGKVSRKQVFFKLLYFFKKSGIPFLFCFLKVLYNILLEKNEKNLTMASNLNHIFCASMNNAKMESYLKKPYLVNKKTWVNDVISFILQLYARINILTFLSRLLSSFLIALTSFKCR